MHFLVKGVGGGKYAILIIEKLRTTMCPLSVGMRRLGSGIRGNERPIALSLAQGPTFRKIVDRLVRCRVSVCANNSSDVEGHVPSVRRNSILDQTKLPVSRVNTDNV